MNERGVWSIAGNTNSESSGIEENNHREMVFGCSFRFLSMRRASFLAGRFTSVRQSTHL
jgi:hypothetical protein